MTCHALARIAKISLLELVNSLLLVTFQLIFLEEAARKSCCGESSNIITLSTCLSHSLELAEMGRTTAGDTVYQTAAPTAEQATCCWQGQLTLRLILWDSRLMQEPCRKPACLQAFAQLPGGYYCKVRNLILFWIQAWWHRKTALSRKY